MIDDRIRSVFLSDLHLGSRFAASKEALEFLLDLQDHHPKVIYLVGDIIDGWKLKRNWYWTDTETLIVRKLLSFARDGTKIIYVTGNHDEFLRPMLAGSDQVFGNMVRVTNQIVHHCANGENLLVVHGDRFDLSVRYAPWLCRLGDLGYEVLLRLNVVVNRIRKHVLRRDSHWSLSEYAKRKVKNVCTFVSDFEDFLLKEARSHGCDGVVCGHLHIPAMHPVPGRKYFNCGDWVESKTALLEFEDGTFEIYRHDLLSSNRYRV